MTTLLRRGWRAYPESMIANGYIIAPSWLYRSEWVNDNTPSVWYDEGSNGADLELLNDTLDPAYGQSVTPLGAPDLATDYTAGSHNPHRAPSNAENDLTTNDLAFYAVAECTTYTTNPRAIFGKSVFITIENRGYYLRFNTSHQVEFRYKDAAGNGGDIVSAALATGNIYHIMGFVDTSEASTNGSQLYVNGVRSGAGVDLSAAGSITAAALFMISRESTSYSSPMDGAIVSCGLWEQAGWWPGGASNPALWDTIADDYFKRWVNGVQVS